MNKKGFTLIELLAVIVILAIIALIATPRITDAINEAREKEYKIQENYISKAAMNFVAVNREYIPDTKGQINIVKLSTLQTSNMIGDVFDPMNSSQKCDGYVYVKKGEEVDVETEPFLSCKNNYVTDNYNETSLSEVEVLIVAGGGSGANTIYATGGGGGGNGETCGKPGLNNTGNGGNGVYAAHCASSGSGGSGIIIVRYPGIQKANGGTITSIDGYTIHTYTEVGNHVFQVLEF